MSNMVLIHYILREYHLIIALIQIKPILCHIRNKKMQNVYDLVNYLITLSSSLFNAYFCLISQPKSIKLYEKGHFFSSNYK